MNKYEMWEYLSTKRVNTVGAKPQEGVRYRIVSPDGSYCPDVEGELHPIGGIMVGCNGDAAWTLNGYWFTESGHHINYDWYLEVV